MVNFKKILLIFIVILIGFWAFIITGISEIFIAVIIIAILFYYIISLYNSLVNGRNSVRNAWSKIDIQLNRRVDLIENLVQTVKGYSIHEKDTLIEVTKARSNLMSSKSISELEQSNNELSNSLANLYVVLEKYPDLKANGNFLNLQEELKQTENLIAKYRENYNNQVLNYNNLCEQFPSNIIAILFNFNLADFFEVDNKKRELPNVEF